MKKLVLIFTMFTLVLTSCSSDDDSSSSQDPLIGTWTWFQSFEDGVEQTLDDCEKMYKITASSDGAIVFTYYFDNNGTCELEDTDSQTWESLGNNVYRFTYEAGTPDEESYEGKIVFENNTLIYEEVDGGITYKDVYIKN